MLTFASDDAAVGVDTYGTLQLLGNYYGSVQVDATAVCGGASDAAVSRGSGGQGDLAAYWYTYCSAGSIQFITVNQHASDHLKGRKAQKCLCSCVAFASTSTQFCARLMPSVWIHTQQIEPTCNFRVEMRG